MGSIDNPELGPFATYAVVIPGDLSSDLPIRVVRERRAVVAKLALVEERKRLHFIYMAVAIRYWMSSRMMWYSFNCSRPSTESPAFSLNLLKILAIS